MTQSGTIRPVLRVQDLSVAFHTRGGVVHALDRIGFAVAPGQTMALVGESGSGKSVTAYAIMGLLEAAGKITGGHAFLGETDLVATPPAELDGQISITDRPSFNY